MAKRQFAKLTTAKGIAKYPRLNTPDTKFNPEGVYTTKLILEAVDAVPVEAALKAAAEAALAEATEKLNERIENEKGEKKVKAKAALAKLEISPLPITDEVDDEGNPTGRKVVSFKMKASFMDPKTKAVKSMKPDILDAKLNVLHNPPEIWGGTVMRVSASVIPFYNAAKNAAGVSLRLRGVQIIQLVSGGGAGAHDFDEEDGFTADDSATSAPSTTDVEPSSPEGSSDDEF